MVGRRERRSGPSSKCKQACGSSRLRDFFKATLADVESRPDVRIRNEVRHKTTRECACMFRVFYKQGAIRILHGVEEKDELETMLSNPQLLSCEFCCLRSCLRMGLTGLEWTWRRATSSRTICIGNLMEDLAARSFQAMIPT